MATLPVDTTKIIEQFGPHLGGDDHIFCEILRPAQRQIGASCYQ